MTENNNFVFIAEKEDENERIDKFISYEIEDMSRNAIQKLIESENIIVNDRSISKNYRIKLKDIINVKIPQAEPLCIEPENIQLDILYEDSEIVVINKPQDMVVHPAPGHYTGTLVNALMYHCRNELSGINGIMRPGIVHRIDKDTSGVIVVAKTDKAHKFLALQLAEHSMNRIYNAIVFNNIVNDSGIIDEPIGRHNIERKKMAVTQKNSKKAITRYKVLERFGKFTMIELKLETGRTHQIRVHMSYIGCPVLGDLVYGPKKQPFNLKGQTLHAKSLGFNHPLTGKYMEFETQLPFYFYDVLNKIEKKS